MKFAYLIMAHNNFKNLRLLLSQLDDNRNFLYLLVDKKSKSFNEQEIIDVVKKGKLVILDRMVINWAGSSQIYAELKLLKEAIKEKCDYYHFITGLDFPLKTNEEIQKFFKKNSGYEFIDFDDSNREFAKFKVNYYHFFANYRYFRNNKIFKITNYSIVKLQQLFKFSRNNQNLYHGSAYFSITYNLAKYIVERKEYIEKKYKYTLAADEVFFQTEVMNSPYKNSIYKYGEKNKGNLRFIDWKRRKGNSPYTFKEEDFNLLISMGEDICFARKFDEKTDSNIVPKLYEWLKQRGAK